MFPYHNTVNITTASFQNFKEYFHQIKFEIPLIMIWEEISYLIC